MHRDELERWGNCQLAPERTCVLNAHRDSGEDADAVLMERTTSLVLSDPVFQIVAGPAAGDAVRRRIAAAQMHKGWGGTAHR